MVVCVGMVEWKSEQNELSNTDPDYIVNRASMYAICHQVQNARNLSPRKSAQLFHIVVMLLCHRDRYGGRFVGTLSPKPPHFDQVVKGRSALR